MLCSIMRATLCSSKTGWGQGGTKERGRERERESKREVHLSGMKGRLLDPYWKKGSWFRPPWWREEVLVLFCGIKSLCQSYFNVYQSNIVPETQHILHAHDYAKGKLYYDFKARVGNLEKPAWVCLILKVSTQPKTLSSVLPLKPIPQNKLLKLVCSQQNTA